MVGRKSQLQGEWNRNIKQPKDVQPLYKKGNQEQTQQERESLAWELGREVAIKEDEKKKNIRS